MSVHGRVTWVKVDERVFVDAMTVEVLVRDFAEEYERDGEPEMATAVEQIADMLGEVSRGQGGKELVIR